MWVVNRRWSRAQPVASRLRLTGLGCINSPIVSNGIVGHSIRQRPKARRESNLAGVHQGVHARATARWTRHVTIDG